MPEQVSRFSVHVVNLDPTIGSEISKSRPCVVISPDEMNKHLATVIIAPLTSVLKQWPTRVNIKFQGKNGQIALDQLRTVSKKRLSKSIGDIDKNARADCLSVLAEMFAG